MQKTIFIFAYYSYKDPVFQSAVLPYFLDVSVKDKLKFIVLTFEQQRYKLPKEEISSIKKRLLSHNIIWHQTSWHSGSFKLLKKVFDFLWGLSYSYFLIKKYKAHAIYSEGFPGAVIAHHLAKMTFIPHLVHTYEPHSDYMVEAGVWSRKSWEARLLKRYELIVAKHAKYIFTGTNEMVKRLNNLKIKGKAVRIPSCVDTNLFKYSFSSRTKIRSSFNISETDCVISYLGKFGGMYMDEEIFKFYKACEQHSTINFKYFIFTPDSFDKILYHIQENKLDQSKFVIKTLEREDVFKYLSASDFGLVPVRQFPSKRFCSPIKDGEYWACGLPIIIPDGISDDYLVAEKYDIGIRVENFSHKSLIIAVDEIEKWQLSNDNEEVRKRCRKFALADRSVKKYQNYLEKIFLDL